MRKRDWASGLCYVIALTMLSLLGAYARQGGARTCSYDGDSIEPLYRVRIVDQSHHDHEFCCIRCAELWLAQQSGTPHAVYVTDEASGTELEASSAIFVRSSVVTNRTTGNRVHAFRQMADAESHAISYHGLMLDDGERPFMQRP